MLMAVPNSGTQGNGFPAGALIAGGVILLLVIVVVAFNFSRRAK